MEYGLYDAHTIGFIQGSQSICFRMAVCIYIYIYVYMYTYIHTGTCVCIHVYNIFVYIYTHRVIYAHAYTCIRHICNYVCIYIYTYSNAKKKEEAGNAPESAIFGPRDHWPHHCLRTAPSALCKDMPHNQR